MQGTIPHEHPEMEILDAVSHAVSSQTFPHALWARLAAWAGESVELADSVDWQQATAFKSWLRSFFISLEACQNYGSSVSHDAITQFEFRLREVRRHYADLLRARGPA